MLAPYDSEDARGLLKAAIRDPDPVVFLENEILYGEAFPVDEKILDKDFTVPIGKVKVSCSTKSSLQSPLLCRCYLLQMPYCCDTACNQAHCMQIPGSYLPNYVSVYMTSAHIEHV